MELVCALGSMGADYIASSFLQVLNQMTVSLSFFFKFYAENLIIITTKLMAWLIKSVLRRCFHFPEEEEGYLLQ